MQELITQFGIDWKLLLAQVINFFILLFVLKRYAYTPIINMLSERKKRIEAGIVASDEAKQRLAQAREERKAILLKAEEEAVGLVSQAEKTAEDQVTLLLKSAHEKSEQVIASGQKKLAEDKAKLEEEFATYAQNLIKKGLIATIRKMNPTERDETLIKDALRELKTIQ